MKGRAIAFIGLGCIAVSIAHAQSTTHWVGTWTSSQQIPEPQNALPAASLHDATMRQIVHLSAGGTMLRVHLSNAFGTQPLAIGAVHIAHAASPGSSRIDPSTDTTLTFSGRPDVLIPAGAEYISDPIRFVAAPMSDLAVTFHLNEPPARQTGHPGSRATSYLAPGDHVAAADLPDATKVEHWYTVAAVDVATANSGSAVVALGDSITDGHGSTTNGNDRWTDILAARLQANPSTRNIGVLNQGIGGNHLLTDGLGPNALARFDRDVLAQSGVASVIVLEGVNDLGTVSLTSRATPTEHEAMVDGIIGAYEQMIARAHAHGLKIIGATITPYTGSDYYHPGAPEEQDRVRVNAWIRTAGHFDAVVDFDKLMADPAHPERLLPAYDCGDHLHPSPAGYRAMGEAVPISLFTH